MTKRMHFAQLQGETLCAQHFGTERGEGRRTLVLQQQGANAGGRQKGQFALRHLPARHEGVEGELLTLRGPYGGVQVVVS